VLQVASEQAVHGRQGKGSIREALKGPLAQSLSNRIADQQRPGQRRAADGSPQPGTQMCAGVEPEAAADERPASHLKR